MKKADKRYAAMQLPDLIGEALRSGNAEACGEVLRRGREAAPLLIAALRDKECEYRWWAADALGDIGGAADRAA